MTKEWKKKISVLDYAYQPIVNSYTGDVFGYEALIRNWEQCGFNSIFALFDTAFQDRVLYALDLELRRMAIEKFKRIPGMENKTLFYNLDNRVLEMPDYIQGNTTDLLRELGIEKSSIYFEISERHEFDSLTRASNILDEYKSQNFRIAIDDYGSGYSGLQLLYHSDPDILKIDRFFIDGIQDDPKKKLLAENIVKMAHLLGVKVVAEGIETEKELNYCRMIGCDFLQGYGIARPVTDISRLKKTYKLQLSPPQYGRRRGEDPLRILESKLTRITPVTLKADCEEILNRFKQENLRLLPVVDDLNQPIGCIQEINLKNYVYSPYGIALFKNHSHSRGLESFVSKIPVTEVTISLNSILKIASTLSEANGIVITRNGSYLGILEPSKLIDLINEQEVAKARDQNPLTRLPGNYAINHHLQCLLKEVGNRKTLVYFDFNNFKPFNDVYGFRMGDRAIILFAEILKKELNLNEEFLGHVGGDDFIICFNKLNDTESIKNRVKRIQTLFAEDVRSYYVQEHRENGYIPSKDRNGVSRRFPLLTVSAAILKICSSSGSRSVEELTSSIMKLKKKAKATPASFASEQFR